MGSAWEGDTEATLLLEDAAVAEEGACVGRKSHAGRVHGHATVLADQETLVLLALADRAAAAAQQQRRQQSLRRVQPSRQLPQQPRETPVAPRVLRHLVAQCNLPRTRSETPTSSAPVSSSSRTSSDRIRSQFRRWRST